MKDKKWLICFIVSLIIIFIMAIYILNIKLDKKIGKNNSNTGKASTSENMDDTFRHIRVDEDLSTDGKIEGIEDVRWSNARIMQDENKAEVSIMLNNESKEKKIEARDLTVKLLDRKGNVIASKDTHMNEISENYGYTDLDLDFELNDYVVIYDIKIIAK